MKIDYYNEQYQENAKKSTFNRIIHKLIEIGFDDFDGTYEINSCFDFSGRFPIVQIPFKGMKKSELDKIDLYYEGMSGYFFDSESDFAWTYLNIENGDEYYLQINTENFEEEYPLTEEQKEDLLNSFKYKIYAYDKDRDVQTICGFANDLSDAHKIINLLYDYEQTRTDINRDCDIDGAFIHQDDNKDDIYISFIDYQKSEDMEL